MVHCFRQRGGGHRPPAYERPATRCTANKEKRHPIHTLAHDPQFAELVRECHIKALCAS
jgi:hypothetical protein